MNRQQRRAATRPRGGEAGATTQIFAEATRRHRDGRLAEAEKLYGQVLAVDRRHVGALNLLGVVAIETGRPKVAIDRLRAALVIDDKVAPTHFHLGVALQNDGRHADAAEAYRAALSLKPDYVAALNNLGLALTDLGRSDEAAKCYEKAVALDPGAAGAHYNLARARRAQGRLDEAALCYRRAIAIEPSFADAHSSLGIVLKEQGKAGEAVRCFREVLRLRPDYPEALCNLGNALREDGRFGEATDIYEQAIRLGKDVSQAYHGLSVCRKFTSADGALIDRMAAALADPRFADGDRALLRFALGKAFDDLGDYESAIAHFDAGNRIERATRRYDPADVAKTVDWLIAAHQRDHIGPAAAASDSELPLLIVGMPRSGTTLVEQILGSHPRIAPGGELGFWPQRLDRIRAGVISRLEPEAEVAAIRDYLALLRAYAPGAAIVSDKMPFNYLFLGPIHRLFPGARIIHCRRNPIDTALSIYFTRFVGPHDFAYDRATIVHYLSQYQRLMAHWRAVLPPNRFLEIDYEELVADPEAVSRRMVAFRGLDWDQACLDFHKTDRPIVTASAWQARQPVYRSSAERWRNYEPWLGELRDLPRGAET